MAPGRHQTSSCSPPPERGYGPDLHVADTAVTDAVEGILLPGSALSLVAEQTSASTRLVDLTDKADVYGRGGVPVHVLIDMTQGIVTVHSEPTPDNGYRAKTWVKFGEKIRIPAPFDFELDTAGWQV
ncbi:Uma2 family endonuclease [Streptomyces luteireticuli]|uniref:Uma2 family endonuclease n=1 Tax=Streptomyces luteireticuli TaxID=173858 RepID=UPI0035574765